MMTGWANFFLAQVGAAAALTGLIFVAVSSFQLMTQLQTGPSTTVTVVDDRC